MTDRDVRVLFRGLMRSTANYLEKHEVWQENDMKATCLRGGFYIGRIMEYLNNHYSDEDLEPVKKLFTRSICQLVMNHYLPS